MSSLYQVNAGDRILAVDNIQFYNLLKGVAASGEPITLIYNAAGVLVLQPSSDPAAGTELIQIKNNAGTVQSALSSDGRFYAADGAVGTPGQTFESEKGSGLYRIGAGDVGLAILGVKVAEFTASLATVVQPLTVSGASLSVGATPAASGLIRIGNAKTVTGKNSGGTDVDLLQITAGDIIQVGNTGATPILLGTTGGVTISAPGKLILAGTITGGGLLTNAVQVGTSGPLVYSGSGAPSISAAVKGSLYLRTDGTTTNDRIYVAKDTAGTWASLTSAS